MFKMSKKRKELFTVSSYLFVPVILLILFSYYPLFKLFQISFTSWNGISPEMEYIGFENYIDVFKQKEIFEVLINNMAYIITALVQQFVGLFLAVLLDSNIRMRKTFRAMIFMPYIINSVAVAFMFNYLYDFTNSPINVILQNLGLENMRIHFLGMKYSSNFALSFISFWKYVGYTMVIFLAALQSISKEVYEAARVDGAGFWRTVFYITLPNIKKMLQISLLLSVNGALQAYFEPYIITRGGPDGRTDTFITKSLFLAFDYNKFGKAAVMGIILLVIILAIALIQKLVIREEK